MVVLSGTGAAASSIHVIPQRSPATCHVSRSCRNQRYCGRRNPFPLEAVAASLSASLPQQQEQLALLRRVSAYTSARLAAQAARPSTYAGELALTPQQRNIRGLAHVSHGLGLGLRVLGLRDVRGGAGPLHKSATSGGLHT